MIFKNKKFNLIIKISISLLLILSIYWHVNKRENLNELIDVFFLQLQYASWHWLLIGLLLMPLNWLLEALKWKQFAWQGLSVSQAFKATLAGTTLAMFTPNRIGDYGGRALLVDQSKRWSTVFASVAGSYCQWIVLISFGIIGFTYFGSKYLIEDIAGIYYLVPLSFTFVVILLGLPFFLRHLDGLYVKLEQNKYFNKIGRNLRKLANVKIEKIFNGIGIAALRYAVYSFQYYCMLHFYGIQLHFLDAFSGIASIFFIQTSVPLPPISALLARGQIALVVWGIFGANDISILAATFTLFIINLLLPAFWGLMLILNKGVIKSEKYA